jgi:hypothetical protein
MGSRGDDAADEPEGEGSGVISKGNGGRSEGLKRGVFNCGRSKCDGFWKESSENRGSSSSRVELLWKMFESSSLMSARVGAPSGV